MPTNPFDALKNIHSFDTKPLSPEEQAAQDAQAQQAQSGDPGWQQAARRGINGGIGALRGLVGSDDGSQGLSPNHLAQMGSAMLPMLPGGILGRLKSLVGLGAEAAPAMLGMDAAQAASRSASDVFNSGTAGMMHQMYQEANPVFRGLEEAGTFGGNRQVGGVHLNMQPGGAPAETLGERNAMFTPNGGEGMFNMAKKGLHEALPVQDPQESAFQALLKRGGR